jgi:UDP-N-acetylglucosamine:LPS N-acetylglucosamine transferase
LLPQAELTPERLVLEIASILRDRPLRETMSQAARQFAHPDAAAQIAAMAIRAAGFSVAAEAAGHSVA